jgi:metal-responsive CopG/Arc/MetJ family transcriptional regulator
MKPKKEEFVKISSELLKKVDKLVEQLDFGNREAFVEAAVRRLIDHYRSLINKDE